VRRDQLGKLLALPAAMRAAVLSVALAACAYRPGSFAYLGSSFPGQRTTVGCLDIAVERRPDLPTGAVVGYQFANRCDGPTVVDLAHVAVVGRTRDGMQVDLAPYDPEGELEPLSIDGRTIGREALAYLSQPELAEICVNAASIAQGTEPMWMCFAQTGGTP
jgi:hypothetical protein